MAADKYAEAVKVFNEALEKEPNKNISCNPQRAFGPNPSNGFKLTDDGSHRCRTGKMAGTTER